MYQVNSFAVRPASLYADEQAAVMAWNSHLLDQHQRSRFCINIKRLDFAIQLAPLTHMWMTAEDFANYSPNYIREPAPLDAYGSPVSILAIEQEECWRHQLIFEHLSAVYMEDFPQLQRLTIHLRFHLQDLTPNACALSFKIVVNLRLHGKHTKRINRLNIAHLEPKRRLFAPLAKMKTLHNVYIKRNWVYWVGSKDGAIYTHRRFVQQTWVFKDIQSLLLRAGKAFTNFQTDVPDFPKLFKKDPMMKRHGQAGIAPMVALK